jgi:hypothetical protein
MFVMDQTVYTLHIYPVTLIEKLRRWRVPRAYRLVTSASERMRYVIMNSYRDFRSSFSR